MRSSRDCHRLKGNSETSKARSRSLSDIWLLSWCLLVTVTRKTVPEERELELQLFDARGPHVLMYA
jgi:hypothetical protein